MHLVLAAGRITMINTRHYTDVTCGADYLGTVQSVLDCLPDRSGIKLCAGVVVAESTVSKMKCVNVRLGTVRMTLVAFTAYQPVVMRCVGCMRCCTTVMTGITGDVRPDTNYFICDIIRSITIRNSGISIAMGIYILIMAGNTIDCRTDCHIVISGPDRSPVMAGQYIAHRSGMTGCTGSIRRRS